MRKLAPTPLQNLLRDDRGNFLMLTALALIPVTAVVGAGVDYGRSARAQQELNAAADAAVLLGVSQNELRNNTSNGTINTTQIQADVTRMFIAQANNVLGINANFAAAGNVAVTVTQPPNNNLKVNVSLTYNASINNNFMGIVGQPVTQLTGTSGTTSNNAPNIDFTVMMDTSPSMLFPVDNNGISTMSSQTGCAYACHQGGPLTSDNTTTYFNGTYDQWGNPQYTTSDYYGYARYAGLTLRFDDEQNATSQLMSTAYSAGVKNLTKYAMTIDTFDVGMSNLLTQTQITDGTPSPDTSGETTAAAAATTASLYVPWRNNYDANNVYNNDQDTHFEDMMTALNTSSSSYYIPNSGYGTNAAGDTPQQYLFLITD
ncbi:MAG: Tad domain-containing protein, partial [Alphaproteobacteria bacterium]|nr:Tad domain-containing protein [Alphaproteobacteria bacterium]